MTEQEVTFVNQCKQAVSELNSVCRDYVLRSQTVKLKLDALKADDMWDSVCGVGTNDVGVIWSDQIAGIPNAQYEAYAIADLPQTLQELRDSITELGSIGGPVI